MKRITCSANKPSNYIYHMLSIAKVGYDNNYGNRYRAIHNSRDLDYLKDNEIHLTVSGGEHCGKWYGVLIAEPANAKDMIYLRNYYDQLIRLFDSRQFNKCIRDFLSEWGNSNDIAFDYSHELYNQTFELFIEDATPIVKIAKIFLESIVIYESQVWPDVCTELFEFKDELEKRLNNHSNLITLWEQSINETFDAPLFEVVLCNSIENGPQAINISRYKDIFGVSESVEDLIGFISHEIGSFIILSKLSYEMQKDLNKYWLCLESLSTYHNRKILYENDELFYNENQYFQIFNKIYEEQPNIRLLDVLKQATI